MTTTTDGLRLTRPPIATTAMLIRKPVADVFAAFVDPAITSRFWFTRGSGRLEPGARVTWEWEMYGASAPVAVLAVEPDERILVEWGKEGSATTIEWRFAAQPDGTTFVSIENRGFAGDGDAVLAQVIDATEGFTFLLAGLKPWLEHGIALNLIGDRFPAGTVGA